jgi:hypothetical protein
MAHEPRQPFYFYRSLALNRVVQAAIGDRLKTEYEVPQTLPSVFYALIARMDEIDERKINRRYRSQGRPATEDTEEGMAIEARHRDKNGEVGRKHGNTLIRTLRKTYGPSFGKGCSEKDQLSDVLHRLDEPSLGRLIRDHEAGKLAEIYRR